MDARIGIAAVALVAGTLGALGSHIVAAQQPSENRTVLVTSDLRGIDGYEVRIWRTDIPAAVAGAKHYHPGTECIYVLEGALNLEKEGEPTAHLRAGDAHCVPPRTALVLTPHHFHEHSVHEEFFKQHMQTKGKELAEACVAIVGQLAAVA